MIAFFFMVICLLFIFLALLVRYSVRLYRRFSCSLENEVVLITGAGGGFGRALCHEFANQKCHVICVDLDEKNNECTVEELKQVLENTDTRTIGYTCDVSDKEQVLKLAEKVEKDFGRLDILVNNAGIIHAGPFLNFTDSILKKTMDVNVVAHFWMIQAFLPQMLKRNKGCIVGISSIASFAGMPEVVPYCTSKFAVAGMMESLKAEFGQLKTRVRTLTVHPGMMSTNMMHECFAKKKRFRWFYISTPSSVAEGVINAIKEKRTSIVLPEYYNLLMAVYRLSPSVFKNRILHQIFTANEFINRKLLLGKSQQK